MIALTGVAISEAYLAPCAALASPQRPRRIAGMSAADAARLEELRRLRQEAFDTGTPIEPLVGGQDHALLARQVAAEIRALVDASGNLAELVNSWQYLAGMCGLFDGLDEPQRPDRDWRARIEQSLAVVEEATE
jgi:hypothetical protein